MSRKGWFDVAGDNAVMRQRRSIRLAGFDYSQAGAYFVTICTQNGVCLFGDVLDGDMVFNDAGNMVITVWHELPEYYPGVGIDAFQIMPNHVHGIIVLHDPVGATPCGRPESFPNRSIQNTASVGATPCGRPSNGNRDEENGQARGPAPTVGLLSLPDVVHRFKTMTTKRYVDGVKQCGYPGFPGRLWQRNYYEHIIRDEDDLNRIRSYIEENPVKWESDRDNMEVGEIFHAHSTSHGSHDWRRGSE